MRMVNGVGFSVKFSVKSSAYSSDVNTGRVKPRSPVFINYGDSFGRKVACRIFVIDT